MMNYAQGLKIGTSTCFCGISEKSFAEIAAAGINCVELSTNLVGYTETLRFAENYETVGGWIADAGLELWSIHMPFSSKLDISSANDEGRELCMKTNLSLIEAAAKIGVKVVVLHPSSEPISDEERPSRIARSRENILVTQELCSRLGVTLAVENLPRTCLCNRSQEMVELLRGTGASVVFDTNHSLVEDNADFLTAVASEMNIASLHISDYDFINERHRLPGDGINDWNAILSILEKIGYKGPLMYEVPKQPKEREPIAVSELTDNMRRLAAGLITKS